MPLDNAIATFYARSSHASLPRHGETYGYSAASTQGAQPGTEPVPQSGGSPHLDNLNIPRGSTRTPSFPPNDSPGWLEIDPRLPNTMRAKQEKYDESLALAGNDDLFSFFVHREKILSLHKFLNDFNDVLMLVTASGLHASGTKNTKNKPDAATIQAGDNMLADPQSPLSQMADIARDTLKKIWSQVLEIQINRKEIESADHCDELIRECLTLLDKRQYKELLAAGRIMDGLQKRLSENGELMTEAALNQPLPPCVYDSELLYTQPAGWNLLTFRDWFAHEAKNLKNTVRLSKFTDPTAPGDLRACRKERSRIEKTMATLEKLATHFSPSIAKEIQEKNPCDEVFEGIETHVDNPRYDRNFAMRYVYHFFMWVGRQLDELCQQIPQDKLQQLVSQPIKQPALPTATTTPAASALVSPPATQGKKQHKRHPPPPIRTKTESDTGASLASESKASEECTTASSVPLKAPPAANAPKRSPARINARLLDTALLLTPAPTARSTEELPDTEDLAHCAGQLNLLAARGGLHAVDLRDVAERLWSTKEARAAIRNAPPATGAALARTLADHLNINTVHGLSLPFNALRKLILIAAELPGGAALFEAIAANLDLREHGRYIAVRPQTNLMSIIGALGKAPKATAEHLFRHLTNSLRLLPTQEFREALAREQIAQLQKSRQSRNSGATSAHTDPEQIAHERAYANDTAHYLAMVLNACAVHMPSAAVAELIDELGVRLNIRISPNAFDHPAALCEAAVNVFKGAGSQFYRAEKGRPVFVNLHYCGIDFASTLLEALFREGKTDLELVVGGYQHWQGPGEPPLRRAVDRFAQEHGFRVTRAGSRMLLSSAQVY